MKSAAQKLTWEKLCAFFVTFLFLVTVYRTSQVGEFWQVRVKVAGATHLTLHSQSAAETLISDFDPSRPRPKERVAICLVGGVRAFELTGPSIKKHLLDVYEDADVFVHAPADANVHKLTLLTGVRHLAALRVFVPERINETASLRQLLTSSGSPNGIQGLLQYFRLVEGCLGMIESFEARYSFKYDWIIRSRVDSYWNAPMLPINAFNPKKYYVPYGSDFGGLNDRLGVGTRETSQVALSRMSLLPKMSKRGYKGLNSETAFKLQFVVSNNVEVGYSRFPFCVLSLRRYPWPAGRIGVLVASIRSKGTLNGAKCRPCTPIVDGDFAWKLQNESFVSISWVGPTDDPQLCDAHGPWEEDWEAIFDEVAGHDMAELRKRMDGRSVSQCVEDVQVFQQQWQIWDAPSPQVLCGEGKSARQ